MLRIAPNGKRDSWLTVDIKSKVILHDKPRKCSRLTEELIQTDEIDHAWYLDMANFHEPGWVDKRIYNAKNFNSKGTNNNE